MRVPMVRQSCHGGRWETIRYALDSNARTFRLCLIWAVVITSPAVAAAIADLIRHMLLCRHFGSFTWSGLKVRYVSSEEFTNDFINMIRAATTPRSSMRTGKSAP